MSAISTVSSIEAVGQALGYPPAAKTPTPLEVARANCRLAKLPVEPMPGGHRTDAKGRDTRGAARLLSGIAQPFTEADAHAMLTELPDVAGVTIAREWRAASGKTVYMVSVDHKSIHADAHVERWPTLLEAVNAVIASYRANPMGREDQPNAKELRREVYRDDGDAVKGTLPLVSVGPGPIASDTQTEIAVDPDDRCPNCKAVFGPWQDAWAARGPDVVSLPHHEERCCPDCSEFQRRKK